MPKLIGVTCVYCQQDIRIKLTSDPQRCPVCDVTLIVLDIRTRVAEAERLAAREALSSDRRFKPKTLTPRQLCYVRTPAGPAHPDYRLLTVWHPAELVTAPQALRITQRHGATLYAFLKSKRIPGATRDSQDFWQVPRASIWPEWVRPPKYKVTKLARSVRRNAARARARKQRAVRA